MKITWKMLLAMSLLMGFVALAGQLVDQGQSGANAWPVSISSAVSGSANGSWVYLDGGQTSVNVIQIGGNSISTGSGVLGSGTQRVVLATDQPAIPSVTVIGSITNPVTVKTVTTGGSPGNTPLENAGSILTSEAVSVPSNGTACTAPAGASCTAIFGSSGVTYLSFQNLTITITNTGANPLTNCIISWDTDGVSYEAWDTTTFAGLAAGTTLSMSIKGNSRRYLRIYGRSALGTATTVVVTANSRVF